MVSESKCDIDGFACALDPGQVEAFYRLSPPSPLLLCIGILRALHDGRNMISLRSFENSMLDGKIFDEKRKSREVLIDLAVCGFLYHHAEDMRVDLNGQVWLVEL